jgi:hypothetical protein
MQSELSRGSVTRVAATEPTTQSWNGLCRLGGVLLVVTGIGLLAASRMAAALYRAGYPSNATTYLQLVSRHQLLANSLWSLWILADCLLIVPAVALYLVLRRDDRTLALLGTLLVGFFCFYDVSVTELNSLTLVSLARGYAGATTTALGSSYLAAATYGYAALPLQTVLSFALGSLGALLWSLAMLKGHTFPRWIAISGIVVNLTGIIGAAAPIVPASVLLGLCQFLAIPLSGLWFIAVGIRLYRVNPRPGTLERTARSGETVQPAKDTEGSAASRTAAGPKYP